MSFQFLCPHGHLLEVEESHAGMQTECPECGIAMVIPPPVPQPLAPTNPDSSKHATGPVVVDTNTPAAPSLNVKVPVVHIPCPNGHELESPIDMLGMDVLCPHCAAQFRLRNEDSREYHDLQQKRERDRARFWFTWSVAAAVVVIFGLAILLAITFSPKRE
jgi:hypothetical protein